MAGVPYIFANATTSIPLSQLDVNFSTPVTIGNTTVALGNTITSIGNITLANTNIVSPFTAPNMTDKTDFGFKNRIINGAMTIDQRNASANSTAIAYTVDRWSYYAGGVTGKFTWGQNLNSVTPPTGFTNYLGFQSTSAYSLASTDRFGVYQGIEGYNVADLAWGNSNAKTVTLSFWVYSSLTGTFGAFLSNNAGNRYYGFTYSIPVANTWTQISVTIPGDVTGTWATNNVTGIQLNFSLGAGSAQLISTGWGSTAGFGVTGQTNVVSTNAATWYVTGVQFEVGSTATSFDFRDITKELQMCQRYFEMSYSQGTAVGTNTSTGTYQFNAASDGGNNFAAQILYKVTKRTNAAVTAYLTTGTSGSWNYSRSGASSTATVTAANYSDGGFLAVVPVGAAWVAVSSYGHWTASAEL